MLNHSERAITFCFDETVKFSNANITMNFGSFKVSRRPGNPKELIKRPNTDIPVSIYFFRSPALLVYFYEGLLRAFFEIVFNLTKDTLNRPIKGQVTIRIIYIQ